jgi:uncharacterized glyoxalase superfamily protein PhnB
MAKKPTKKPAAKSAKAKPAKKAVKKASPIPKGLTTTTTMLSVKSAAEAIEFYKKAFGAKEVYRMASPDGKSVWHAELRIGTGAVMLSDESPMSPMRGPKEGDKPTGGIQLYVKDCDATFDQAVKAGAKVTMPVADTFWGDRMGSILDPSGVPWMIATRKKDMTKKQMDKAAEEFMKNMPPPAPAQS